MNNVFVYGTLKRGQRNNHFMRGARYLGAHVTASIYSMYDFDTFPAVCVDGRDPISGEVYRVDDRQLRRLDDLEWCPHFYQRIEIATAYGAAWMYVVTADICRGKIRLSGNWS